MGPRDHLKALQAVQSLVDEGRFAEVVSQLRALPLEELERSHTLALYYGIALGRQGKLAEAEPWASRAAEQAREQGDAAVRMRALNVCGAIALEGGDIPAAADYFLRGFAAASETNHRAVVARCCNNLGIVSNIRGEYIPAIGYYEMAAAAFEQLGMRAGVAEARHNLAITYVQQGHLSNALDQSAAALADARAAGDLALTALATAGRAEIHLLAGDIAVARREVDAAQAIHHEIGDVVGETETLLIQALLLNALGRMEEAERVLRDVIDRAEIHRRPLLVAKAEGELARLLHRTNRGAEAKELAHAARVRFAHLGAVEEVKKIDELFDALGKRADV